MGVTDLIAFNVWTVTSLDAAVWVQLEGQFSPDDGMSDNAAPQLGSTATVGSERPAVQWLAGGRRVVSFRSSFVSLNELDDIRARIEALAVLSRRDASLGRAPRVVLTWGELLIEGFATVDMNIAGWWPVSGFPMRVDFTLEITEALQLTGDSSSGTGETQYRTLAEGELLETLGAAMGDPMLGELIRRVNPRIAAGEAPGDRVKILERSHPRMQGRPRPSAPSLLGLAASSDVAAVLEDLAASRGVALPGTAWERLPEVVAGEV